MAVEFLINRLKALFIFLLGIFRRTLCCLRRRRRSSCDGIPLSEPSGELPTVIINRQEQDTWDQWDENPVVVVPDNSIQSKIDQYRQQITKPSDSVEEPQINFFEDMTPKITKQKKILLRNQNAEQSNMNVSKFAVATERVPTNELEIWEDNTAGWEEETVEEFGDPTHALREQRKRERERRLYEQRRLQYSVRPQPLGEKINS
ncbi:hypothetical protein PV327_000844 [Microctonus hyperodae]|uniref:Receptor-binding cancer antigen expressed on SiSo cells n=1 Tax=Microctonus hyperodae TaxID=165561 RepID=A0AA39L2Q1_MICHY|nr:hypothetical protein PV327_000844 [Microctonus hyperodae]